MPIFSKKRQSITTIKRDDLLTLDSTQSSTSSTECVHDLGGKKHQEAQDSATIQAKRVRFDLENRTQSHLSAANEKYKDQCWLDINDLKACKRDVVIVAKQLVRAKDSANKSYLQIMSHVYNRCCEHSQDFSISEYESFLSVEEQLEFKKCIANANSHTGLERMTVARIIKDMKERRKTLLKHIEDCSRLPDCSMKREMMRRGSEALTLPSRLFALEKARALSDLCFCWWILALAASCNKFYSILCFMYNKPLHLWCAAHRELLFQL